MRKAAASDETRPILKPGEDGKPDYDTERYSLWEKGMHRGGDCLVQGASPTASREYVEQALGGGVAFVVLPIPPPKKTQQSKIVSKKQRPSMGKRSKAVW